MKSYLGWKVDYAHPEGELGLVGPDSVSWRVFKNKVALGVGGISAVLMEFADARIRSGVWDHSTFKTDPIGRSKRTGIAAMAGVFGPESAARRIIQGVNNMHARVAGETPSGEAYQALDTELLDWVSATASYAFLKAYDTFVAPVSETDQQRYFIEGSAIGTLYGAKVKLTSRRDFDDLLARMLPRFEPHPINHEFLGIISSTQALPGMPAFFSKAAAHAAVEILPQAVRSRLELGTEYNLTTLERRAVKALAAIAERIPEPNGPPQQACRRLGLPADFLYKTPAAQARLLNAWRATQAINGPGLA
jgi:uncharacterized protein (DUF2236 family)